MSDGFTTKKVIKEPENLNEDWSMYAKPKKRPQQQNNQATSAIKGISSKAVSIEIEGKSVNIPSMEYVNALEKDNTAQRAEMVKLKNHIQRLANEIRKLQSVPPMIDGNSWFK